MRNSDCLECVSVRALWSQTCLLTAGIVGRHQKSISNLLNSFPTREEVKYRHLDPEREENLNIY